MLYKRTVISSSLSVLLTLLGLACLGLIKFLQIQQAIAQQPSGPPPTGVSTITVHLTEWQQTYVTPGIIRGQQGTTLSLQEGGVITYIGANDRDKVKAGDVLLELDTSVEKAQLQSALANNSRLSREAKRAVQLKKRGAISDLDYDAATTSAREAKAEVARIKAVIKNKTLSAPYSGQLGIFDLKAGDYVAPGTPLVRLENKDSYEVDFALPQSMLPFLPEIKTVQLDFSPYSDSRIELSVAKFGAGFSRNTLTLPLRATLPREKVPDKLADSVITGAAFKVEVPASPKVQAIVLPTSAIAYAPYGNSVFVMDPATEGETLRGIKKRTVELGQEMHSEVRILKGLKAGEEVVSSGVFKLREGAPVIVNNSIEIPQKSPEELPDT